MNQQTSSVELPPTQKVPQVNSSVKTKKKSLPERLVTSVLAFLGRVLPRPIVELCLRFDRRVDGAISFFIKHYGKSRFMIAMSKKAQILGIEKLWIKSPKAFVYFFLYYLVRDTILYIILPITIARLTTG